MTPRWRAADAGQPTLTASKPPRSQLRSTRPAIPGTEPELVYCQIVQLSSGPVVGRDEGRSDVPVGDPERMTAPGEAERVARLRPAHRLV